MKPRTPAQLIRDIDARNAAMRVYAEAYDRLATQAQVEVVSGHVIHAAITRHRAAIALRAFRAETRPS